MNTRSCLLYEKIADTIRSRIAEETYPVDTKMPSEEVLAGELSVSRPTIKKAVSILEKEGLIQCRPAVGSFIRRKPTAGLVFGYVCPSLNDPFHADVIRELNKTANSLNSSLMVGEGGHTTGQFRKAVTRLEESGVSGLILSGGFNIQWQEIEAISLPSVWCGGVPPTDRVDRVSIDPQSGMEAILDHLRETGSKTFGYALGEKIDIERDGRFKVFLAYMEKHRLETRNEWQKSVTTVGEQGGRELLVQFKNGTSMPDTIVCYNDWIAIGLIREALESGITIPETLRVTGFDNLSVGCYLQVPVTTIDYKIPALVKKAAELLLKRIGNPSKKPESCFLKGSLVIRSSTVVKEAKERKPL